jgi:hypothetical protein
VGLLCLDFYHAHRNEIFPDDALVIGHEPTPDMLLGDVLNQRTYKSFTSGIPGQMEEMKYRAIDQEHPTFY